TPGLVACAMFAFMSSWGEFLYALLFTSTLSSKTMPIVIAGFVTDVNTSPTLMNARGVLAVIPPLARALLVALVTAGCKGVASSAGAPGQTPQTQQRAAGAKVSSSTGPPKVTIDRDCSKLGDTTDEYVCVKNDDQRPADMGSWVLRNVMGRSFNF